jgi:probable F420-dependent oxidoreductase
VRLSPVGVWWSGSWDVEGRPELHAATELEALGYGAISSSGGFNPGLSSRFGRLLAATTTVVVASGIVNIWKAAAEEIASAVADLDAKHPGRFLLGLGASHGPLVEEYNRPYTHMVAYLDALEAAVPTVSKDHRVLAALGPRMLELAAERSAGAHPYFVPVEHTAFARDVMGTGPLLAPELTVVLESDPKRRERWRAASPPGTWGFRTTPTTCAGSASTWTTWPVGGATGWSMPQWRGATLRPSPDVSASITTPGRTTSAFR